MEIKKHSIVMLFAIAMPIGNIIAQDLTRLLPSIADEMIIRHKDPDTSLCYNYGKRGGEFYKVTEAGPVTDAFGLWDVHVHINDFEIFNDTAYFCGYRGNSAIMGFFPVKYNLMPPVVYTVVHALSSFEKLDVFSVKGHVHVAMTAIEKMENPNIRQTYTIVDAQKHPSGNWDFDVMTRPQNVLSFDDVRATRTCVMFTAKGVDEKDSTLVKYTEVWVFSIPDQIGYTLFQNTANVSMLEVTPTSPILIDLMDKDSVVIVSNTDIVPIVSSKFGHYFYRGSCDIIVPDTVKARDVMGIEYCPMSNCFDILTCDNKNPAGGSRLYTVHESRFTASGTIGLRWIAGLRASSIDCLLGSPCRFSAAGLNYGQDLYVLKYSQSVQGNCFPVSEYEAVAKKYRDTKIYPEITLRFYHSEELALETYYFSVQTTTICN